MQLIKVIINKRIIAANTVLTNCIVIILVLSCSFYCKAQIGPYGTYFIHNSTTENSNNLNWTNITNTAINFDATIQLQVTPNYSKGNTYCNFSYGVWYDSADTNNTWTVYNETEYELPTESGWNVLIPKTQGSSFIHTASKDNITSSETDIDNPALNGNADALFFVTHNLNPGGKYVSGTHNYFNMIPAVYYNNAKSKWAIIDEKDTAFTPNTAFNVFVPNKADANAFIQISNSLNTNAWATYIDNAAINSDTNAVLMITQNLTAGNRVFNNHPVGVWFDHSVNKWAVFNEDKSPIPTGAAFNVLYVNKELTTGVNVGETSNSNLQFNVYPNPSQDIVNITYNLTTSSNVTITLIDMRGIVVKEIKQGNLQEGMQKLTDNVSQLAEGVYVYELQTQTELLHKKIMVIH